MFYKTIYASPVGDLTLASDGSNIIGLWLEGQKYFQDTVSGNLALKNDLPVFQQAKLWLDAYFAGQHPLISALPLAPIGNDFRQAVWKILCEIPYGEVTTSGAIAKQISAQRGIKDMPAQAVGWAVGHNPISIIIPCHRVVGTDGNLTGYAGGISNKIKLLTLEGVDMQRSMRQDLML